MNLLLMFLFLLNVLQNDGDSLPEMCVKNLNTTEETPQFRVVNGTKANLKQFPYQVSMKMRSRSTFANFCGGTIIAPSKVLSAAHCFYTKKSPCSCSSVKQTERSLTNMYVVAGTLSNKEHKKAGTGNGKSQWRKIKRTAAPNDYDFPRRDIAIVFTTKPFIYNDFVNQIPYAQEHGTYVGLKCIASGYGQTETKRPSDVLLWAHLEVITTAKCNKLHKINMKRFVCTSSALTDVGKGDSGGPLVCKKTKHRNEDPVMGILVGITSGKQEAKRGRKGMTAINAFFTRVSSYSTFIQKNKVQIIMPEFILWISAALVFHSFS